MGRPSQLFRNDSGVSSPVGVLMMVILVIALAAIIGSIVFGHVNLFPKSAYIPVETQVKNTPNGAMYLSVFHRNGDASYLNLSGKNAGMPVYFQLTNSTLGTVRPLPDPSDGPATWKPGDTVYVYINKTYGVWVTKNESQAQDKNNTGLPQGVWRFDVVSKVDDVIIYTTQLGVGVPTPTVSPTISPAPTFTSAATNVTGSTITIIFNKEMADPTGKQTQFTYRINGGSPQPFSSAALSGGNIVLTTSGMAIAPGNTVTVSYTKGTVTAADTGALESFVNQPVTNNMVGTAPTFTSAATNVAGTTITIVFNKAMADPTGKQTQFTYRINGGSPQPFSSAALSGGNIVLTTSGMAIAYGNTVTVSYTKGTVTAVDTGILESFVNQPVTNTMPAPSPTQIYFQDFESSVGGWGPDGSRVTGSVPRHGTYSMQLNHIQEMHRTISTTGYTTIILQFAWAAKLRSSHHAYAEYSTNGGTSWTTISQIDGDVDQTTLTTVTSSTLPTSANNNANFQLRFRINGHDNNDHLYVDDVKITGTPI